jgi:PAS domain S-box-containing protein
MKKQPVAASGVTELERPPRLSVRAALIIAAYLITFLILDLITKQFAELPGVVAWYPPAGLTYALLLVFGVGFTPAVTVALFFSSLFVYRMPQPFYLLFLWALIISLIYGLAAAFLRQRNSFDWQLRKLRNVIWLIVVSVLVSVILAVLSVLSSTLSSDLLRREVLSAIFHWWIGETVGVLTVTPFLLIYVMPGLKRFAEGGRVRLPARWSFPPLTLSGIGQVLSLVFMLYWVFGANVRDEYQPLYLIALPLIWIALQHGLRGVSAGIVVLNFGVVWALWFFQFDLRQLDEIQLLMIINCMVGLLMGAVVTERKQAEQMLRESKEKYRMLFAEAPVGIAITTLEGKIIDVNQAQAEMIGFTVEQLIGKSVNEYYVEPDKRIEMIEVLKSNGKVRDFEMKLSRSDGTIITELMNLDKVSIGTMNYLLATGRDITEQKQVEEALRSERDFAEGLIEMAQTIVLVLDTQGRIVRINSYMEEVSGYALAEVQGLDWFTTFLPEDDRERIHNLFLEAISDIQTRGNVDRIVTKDGREREIEWYDKTLKDAQGNVVGLLSTGQDITERMQADQALRESEERFRTLFEQAAVGVALLETKTGRYVRINQKYCDFLGYSIEEMLLRKLQDVTYPDDTQTNVDQNALLIAGTIREFSIEKRYFRKDGTVVWGNLTASPLWKPGTQPETYFHIAVVEDITTRKQAEENLRRQNEYLLALQATTLDLLSQLDLDTLLENIVKRAGQLMDTCSGYLDLVEPETGQLLPRVGLGVLAESLQYEVQPGEGIAGIVWQTRQPLVVDDYNNWPGRIGKFSHGSLYSAMGVPLISGDQVLGVLGLGYDFNYRQVFGPQAVEMLTQFARLAALAIENARLFSAAQQELAERKRAEQKITSALAEKETLLRELYHRTKNNMQVILSMVSLESAKSGNEELKATYRDIASRIQAMALVHQKLYQSQDLSQIDLQDYLQKLVPLVVQNYRLASQKIALRFELEPVEVLIDTAMPFGLVVTELISNSLKHAFPGEMSGEISLRLSRTGEQIELHYADNGVGVSPDFDFRNQKSYGLQSIFALVESQMQGQVCFVTGAGLVCQICFSDTLYTRRVPA